MTFPTMITRKGFGRLKAALFFACLAPFLVLLLAVFGIAGFGLGANPVEELIHRTGLWGLRFLLITLAVTPARHLTGWHWVVKLRRMLGLFAFFYATVHLASFGHFYIGWTPVILLEELVERLQILIQLRFKKLQLPKYVGASALY